MIDKQLKALYKQNKNRDANDTETILELQSKEKTVLCANLDDTIAYLRKASPDKLYCVC